VTPPPYYADDRVTLYHGDCRELTAWLAADVLVTDPPYGMALSSGWAGHHGRLTIAGDTETTARDDALAAWHRHNPSRPALVFSRWSLPLAGATGRLTWDKGEHVGMGDLAEPWKPNTEDVWVFGKGFRAARRGSSVLRFNAVSGTAHGAHKGRWHPTEKPLDLMETLIAACPAGVIADPFAGSGATLVAARNLGRRAIGVELEERYCEVIAKRLAQDVLDLEAVPS
jgi:site-specific DNA-methyltransferase (adenine-specific)